MRCAVTVIATGFGRETQPQIDQMTQVQKAMAQSQSLNHQLPSLKCINHRHT